MIMDLDEELERAEDSPPFSNSTDGDAWTGRWCESCALNVNDDCPLLTVALLGKTPFGWITVNRMSLSRQYLCAEYKETEEDSRVQVSRTDRPPAVGHAVRPPTRLEHAGRHRRG